MWQRQTQWPFFLDLDQRHRLRVVNQGHIGVQVEPFGVDLIDLAVMVPLIGSDGNRVPLQAIVKRLGGFKKGLIALDDLPAGVDAQTLQHGDHPL